MNRWGPLAVVGFAAVSCLLGVHAASPPGPADPEPLGNSYYLFTKDLRVDQSGVVAVPSRYRWSVETGLRGIDLQGNPLPDRRIMLRLYDPDHNFTALTAQMDLATASALHHKLGEIIGKKHADPNFQHRPQLYNPKDIPVKRAAGVDRNGVLIVEDAPAAARPQSAPR
jgi:hypothetical protein